MCSHQTLCRYDLRKGDLFVLSWARVRRSGWEVFLLWCVHLVFYCIFCSRFVRCFVTIMVVCIVVRFWKMTMGSRKGTE